MPLSSGQVLQNRYRIVKWIGGGGFGNVYRAWDLRFNVPLALKESTDTSPGAVDQFTNEARMLYTLSHPGLPKVSDYFSEQGQGEYLVMEFIEGENLKDMLDKAGGSLPVNQATSYVLQVLDALAYLHARQPPIIHRDIKPANIVINQQGKAVLVDFGIAKADPSGLTRSGARAITPGYSPFEQYKLSGTDERSDIYALGATLYALLTGKTPIESIERYEGQELDPPRKFNKEISADLEWVTLKAMGVRKEERFKNAGAFSNALAAAAAPPPVPKPVPQPGPVQGLNQPPDPNTVVQPPIPDTVLTPKYDPAAVSGIAVQAPGGTTNRPASRWLGGGFAFLIVLVLVSVIIIGVGNNLAQSRQQAQNPPPTAVQFTPTENQVLAEATIVPTTGAEISATESSVISVPSLVSPIDGMTMLYVPAGLFLMGSKPDDSGANPDEFPQRTVTLDGFWIDKIEVTNAMYAMCVAAGACAPPSNKGNADGSPYYDEPRYANYPVIWATRNDADSYCRWADRRLPTEAEWEKAARGTEGQTYPWGNQAPTCNLANFAIGPYQCSGVGPLETGSFPSGASPYEALDMAGNQLEWVADWYVGDYYQTAPDINPIGPSTGGSSWVARGGGWGHGPLDIRAAKRFVMDSSSLAGFRCARSP